MKVLVYVGSPRKNGNTYKMSEVLKSILVSKHIDSDFVYAPQVLHPCLHCGKCVNSVCVIRDRWSPYIDNYKEYDGVIFMTPIYFFQFTAQTKAFIDRLGASPSSYWDNKILALITSSGSAGVIGGNDILEESIIRTCNFFDCNYAGCYNKVTNDEILETTEEDYQGILDIVETMEGIYNEISEGGEET